MNARYADLRQAFEAHELDPGAFRHSDHIGVAYEMLSAYDFIEAAVKYAEGIRTLATKAGVPEKFNITITFAFLGLIAERMKTTHHASYEDFISENKDLMSKNVLQRWYSPARLQSALARSVFLMPDTSRQA